MSNTTSRIIEPITISMVKPTKCAVWAKLDSRRFGTQTDEFAALLPDHVHRNPADQAGRLSLLLIISDSAETENMRSSRPSGRAC